VESITTLHSSGTRSQLRAQSSVIVRDPQGSHPAGVCGIARVLRVCCVWSGRSEFLAVFVVSVTLICVVFLTLILSLVIVIKIFDTLQPRHVFCSQALV
jgi:hypothetical protein